MLQASFSYNFETPIEMDLTKINAVGLVNNEYLPQLKVRDMVIDQTYIVEDIQSVETKFGRAVVVHTAENSIFLPKRMSTELSDATIEKISASQLGLVFRGLKTSGKANPAAMVELVKL